MMCYRTCGISCRSRFLLVLEFCHPTIFATLISPSGSFSPQGRSCEIRQFSASNGFALEVRSPDEGDTNLLKIFYCLSRAFGRKLRFRSFSIKIYNKIVSLGFQPNCTFIHTQYKANYDNIHRNPSHNLQEIYHQFQNSNNLRQFRLHV